jgi:hypothetical protein
MQEMVSMNRRRQDCGTLNLILQHRQTSRKVLGARPIFYEDCRVRINWSDHSKEVFTAECAENAEALCLGGQASGPIQK